MRKATEPPPTSDPPLAVQRQMLHRTRGHCYPLLRCYILFQSISFHIWIPLRHLSDKPYPIIGPSHPLFNHPHHSYLGLVISPGEQALWPRLPLKSHLHVCECRFNFAHFHAQFWGRRCGLRHLVVGKERISFEVLLRSQELFLLCGRGIMFVGVSLCRALVLWTSWLQWIATYAFREFSVNQFRMHFARKHFLKCSDGVGLYV